MTYVLKLSLIFLKRSLLAAKPFPVAVMKTAKYLPLPSFVRVM